MHLDIKSNINTKKENQKLRFSFFDGKKLKVENVNEKNRNNIKKFSNYIFNVYIK